MAHIDKLVIKGSAYEGTYTYSLKIPSSIKFDEDDVEDFCDKCFDTLDHWGHCDSCDVVEDKLKKELNLVIEISLQHKDCAKVAFEDIVWALKSFVSP